LSPVLLGFVPERRKGDGVEAEKIFLDILHMDPYYIDAKMNLGNVYRTLLNNPEAAIRQYHQILDLDPTHVSTLVNLADILRSQGNVMGALPLLERALKRDSRDGNALANLSLCFHQLGNTDEAVRIAELCLMHHPSHGTCNQIHDMFVRELEEIEEELRNQ
jgi:tetratricopeptide (TPR) repeat protein